MATALLDQWTEEKCLQLIREYRARPILWDQKDPFFFNKTMKHVAWQVIGAAINIPADQCKHKMIILMSSFRREKFKLMHSLKKEPDPSQVYKSRWFAFKPMSFLMDKESERKRQINNPNEIDEVDETSTGVNLQIFPPHIDKSVHPPKRARRSSYATNEVTHTEQRETDHRTKQHIPGPSQTPQERDEEIKSFTSFIGNKMKKYSDTTKNAVQQAICEIIFKADHNNYENCYEKFTIIDDDADPLNEQVFDDDETIVKIQNDSDSD